MQKIRMRMKYFLPYSGICVYYQEYIIIRFKKHNTITIARGSTESTLLLLSSKGQFQLDLFAVDEEKSLSERRQKIMATSPSVKSEEILLRYLIFHNLVLSTCI